MLLPNPKYCYYQILNIVITKSEMLLQILNIVTNPKCSLGHLSILNLISNLILNPILNPISNPIKNPISNPIKNPISNLIKIPSGASPSGNLISLSYSMLVFSANLFGLFPWVPSLGSLLGFPWRCHACYRLSSITYF